MSNQLLRISQWLVGYWRRFSGLTKKAATSKFPLQHSKIKKIKKRCAKFNLHTSFQYNSALQPAPH